MRPVVGARPLYGCGAVAIGVPGQLGEVPDQLDRGNGCDDQEAAIDIKIDGVKGSAVMGLIEHGMLEYDQHVIARAEHKCQRDEPHELEDYALDRMGLPPCSTQEILEIPSQLDNVERDDGPVELPPDRGQLKGRSSEESHSGPHEQPGMVG